MRKRILHPMIFLKGRNHEIDIHVLEPCSRLWAKGIKTFFSCQGGPELQPNGKIKQRRAMVVVHRKDGKKVLKILKDLNPKLSDNLNFMRIAVTFDASEAARHIPLFVEETKITVKPFKSTD